METGRMVPRFELDSAGQERALSAAVGRLPATDLAKLTVFLAGGDAPVVFSAGKAGTFRTEYASKLRNPASRVVEISFRATAPLTLDAIPFLGTTDERATARVPVRVAVPLTNADPAWRATARAAGQDVPVRMDVRGEGSHGWAEVELELTGRAVVRIGAPDSALPPSAQLR